MITSELQYQTTLAWLARFEASIDPMEGSIYPSARPKLEQLRIDAVKAQAEDLRTELREYGASL